MKSCDEMVNSLLERREQYIVRQKRKRTVIVCAAVSMCCVCLVALLGFGVWQNGMFEKTPQVTLDDSIIIGEKDYIEPDELNNNTNVDSGNYPNNYSSNGNEKTMISSFDIGETISACYAAPENGEFSFSIPLREAINEYGDGVLYRVIIDVFADKEQLSPESSQIQEECERLSNNGYTVACETIFDGVSYHYYFSLHATYEELISFPANENYGYFMFLYNERVEVEEEAPIGYNGTMQ